jgi:tetratricopeptide (TPR) repeat protein
VILGLKMNKIKAIGIVLVTLSLFFSCGTKKDRAINRAYHSITAKYNILYNGGLAYQEGLNQINQKHKDNFWEQLKIEPITFEEVKISVAQLTADSALKQGRKDPTTLKNITNTIGTILGNPTFDKEEDDENKENKTTSFDRAEEKAVKAIQLHSMNIRGRERNSQIDDAYLLLGKSRYYTQRFIPAIEAFNYVITNYPYANLIAETRIWRAKTNIRLENNKFAIETLKLVLASDDLEDRIKEEAHTALAMAYVKTDSIQQAIQELTLATETQVNVPQAARNLFVLGQIYASENKKKSSARVFQKLINFRKAPYKFKVYAHIGLAKAITNDSLSTALIAKFKKLNKARENRPYLDALYYQTGVLEEKRDSLDTALLYLKKSLRVPNGKETQKTYTYEKLGNIAFDRLLFLEASSYYDSVIQITANSTDLRIRKIRRKHKRLASLTKYETILKRNDSILRIVALPLQEQKELFKKKIETLKEADKKRAEKQLEAISFGSSFGGASVKNSNKGKWYFYNTQSLSFGKAEFEKIWGTRPLEDNWRNSVKRELKTVVNSAKKDSIIILPKYDLALYLATIPTTKKAIDSLVFSRNNALYQTGVVYKEQFRNADLSIARLERLLALNPDKTLVLPAKYLLFQLYDEKQHPKSTLLKELIIKEYPTSKYADALQGKLIKEDKEMISVTEAIYKELYYIYKEDKFVDVVSQIIELAPEIKDSNLIAKFELLKALAIGKYQSKESYKKALKYVSFNYGSTEQGQRANEIIRQLN